MDINYVVSKMRSADDLVNTGSFDSTYKNVKDILNGIDEINTIKENRIVILSNLVGDLVNIGGFSDIKNIAEEGLNIFINNKNEFPTIMKESLYYYNLANEMSAVLDLNPNDNANIGSFIKLNDVRDNYWKTLRLSQEDGWVPPDLIVNLANVLKRQYCIPELMDYYEQAISINNSIPRAWINRSEALGLLNELSTTYIYKMIREIVRDYECAIKSGKCFPSWKVALQRKIKYNRSILSESCVYGIGDISIDGRLTQGEHDTLSNYQRFCIDNSLVLSDRSLYCNCYTSSKGNMAIATTEEGVFGDFIMPVGMVLNRPKAGYSLARKMFFEYKVGSEFFDEDSEICYSELYNGEISYGNVEKLRVAFRACFGILDKTTVALCQLFDLEPNRGHICFHNFWRISNEKRKLKINKINNKGLLGLFGIAMDLNDKNGELAFFKEWRSNLEHKLLAIHEKDMLVNLYSSYGLFDEVRFTEKEKFKKQLLQLMKIVRSAAILSVFTIRMEGKKNIPRGMLTIKNTIERKVL